MAANSENLSATADRAQIVVHVVVMITPPDKAS
jgi:hypothetical protein